MKIIVLYDSLYGNTEVIAHLIANTLKGYGEVQEARAGSLFIEQLADIQMLVVGSPTQQFRPTVGMRSFLNQIPKNGLWGVKVAAFDTRLTMSEIEKSPPLPFFERIFGYAAERIAKQLQKKGGELVLPAEGFYVEGMKGPLAKGEVERAEKWAHQLFA
ncbi:MAG: flavodoxin domain-containing protein [Anaerolineales bacterium]